MPDPLRRRSLLAGLLIAPLLAGCGTLARGPGEAAEPALRFASALEAGGTAVEAAIRKMDAFERRVLRDERAIAYALDGRMEADATSPRAAAVTRMGAAEAAGEVAVPAFAALAAYGDRLGMALAADSPGDTHPMPDPRALVDAAAAGLDGVRATVPGPLREAGLAGIAALAATPLPDRRSAATAEAMARAADPHVQAVAALLRAVLGADSASGTRGAIRARRLAMDRNHARLLEAARRDRSVTVAGRYALFLGLTGMRDEDPAPGTLAGIVSLVDAMAAAHAGLVAQPGAAGGRSLAAFEAAVAEIQALAGIDDEE